MVAGGKSQRDAAHLNSASLSGTPAGVRQPSPIAGIDPQRDHIPVDAGKGRRILRQVTTRAKTKKMIPAGSHMVDGGKARRNLAASRHPRKTRK